MQGVIEEKSKMKAASSNIIPMRLILLTMPKEQKAGAESMGTTVTSTRKLPPSIATPAPHPS